MSKLPRSPSRTTTGFAFSVLDRAIRENFADRNFGKQHMNDILKFFGSETPECAFCGNQDVKRWDHLVPVRKGGDTVLGNMVLSCARCDDSKQDLDYKVWMMGSSQYSPSSQGVPDLEERIHKISSYVNRYGYKPCPLDSRLDNLENENLDDLQDKLRSIRADLEMLVRNHRARTDKDPIY